jgi:hypothetical protein
MAAPDRFAAEGGYTGATDFARTCSVVITIATDPTISVAATIAREVRCSPANKVPRITATMGLT